MSLRHRLRSLRLRFERSRTFDRLMRLRVLAELWRMTRSRADVMTDAIRSTRDPEAWARANRHQAMRDPDQ